MRKLFFLTIVITGCSILTPLQKSRFLTLSNLIESAKYEEAKEIIEEMTSDEDSRKWARTWYMKGLLCQTAYQDGVKKNDKKLVELYPEQLFLAFDSYEKALSIDRGGRMERQIAPKYILLANDFQKIGETNFNSKKYSEALKAFEYVLKVSKSPILSVEIDTNLVYNAALAAYESKNWEVAIEHLKMIHKSKYSVNATHLLFKANLAKGDTISSKKILIEGINKYDYNEDLVLLLTDLLFRIDEADSALSKLDEIIAQKPSNYKFHYTKGLIYQKTDQYKEAINSYIEANKYAPEELIIYINIATCYYNIGVEIEEKARTITNNRLALEEKSKSIAAFESAISWLDKVYEKGIDDQEFALRVYDLYKVLRISDKTKSLENLIQ